MDKVAPKSGRNTLASDSAAGALPAPRPEPIQKHLEKVLLSSTLNRSKKLCQFLRFTVGEVLQGPGSDLQDYAIAARVLRRAREFDHGAVRVEQLDALA